MRFCDVPVNRSVPTEANRGLTSYIYPERMKNGIEVLDVHGMLLLLRFVKQ
jgi:hypothetical protein